MPLVRDSIAKVLAEVKSQSYLKMDATCTLQCFFDEGEGWSQSYLKMDATCTLTEIALRVETKSQSYLKMDATCTII